MICAGFQATAADTAVRDRAGIFVLDAFGSALLRDAPARGDACVSAEKSGQVEFDFERGDGFAQHIDAGRWGVCADYPTVSRESGGCSCPSR